MDELRLLRASAAQRAELVAEYEFCERAYAKQAEGHPLLARQVPQYAAAQLAARLLAELTGLDRVRLSAAVDDVFVLAQSQAVVPSPARRAAEILISELESHRPACAVWDSAVVKYTEPRGYQHFGVFNEAQGFCAIDPNSARQALLREDITFEQVADSMRDEGLLLTRGGKFTVQVSLLGRRYSLYKLPYPLPGDGDDREGQEDS